MKWIQYVLLLVCATGYSQTVRITETGNDPSVLVKSLLDNACVQVYNQSLSSPESVAFFNNSGGKFPISEGVVIRSGKAKFSEGRYTGENISSQVNSNGDADLERLNSKSGQSPLITDVAFLEFDFVPLSSNFNFNFLFASNEYGEWQCVSSDVFAFLLTDLSTGETSNLAVIPGTDVPVSVRNLKDNAHNASCESDYPALFSSYQVENPSVSTVNMRGYTKVMNASADIKPGVPYRIRFVIGDSNDANFDSAIFLEAGSFNANVDLGEDRNLCQGDSYTIGTGLDTGLYAHSWTLNGIAIPNETENSLFVTQTGRYGVRVTKTGTSCLVTDEVIFSGLAVKDPVDLKVCYDAGNNYRYDLEINDEKALGINDEEYDLLYFSSMADVLNNEPIPAGLLRNFQSPGNQEIFIKPVNNFSQNSCDAVYSFNLLVNEPLEANKPAIIQTCLVSGSGVNINLTQVESQVLGNQDSAYTVAYFESFNDAEGNIRQITNPTGFKIKSGVRSKTFWVRVQDPDMPECYATVSFEVLLNDPPPVDKLKDVIVCSEYILPELTHGNYFTKPGGTGTPMFAGDVITKSGTYYIFNGPNENGCINESSFKVIIIQDYSIGEKYCGAFTVPNPPVGAFYTRPGGPGEAGKEIPVGTVFTENLQIFYFAEIEGRGCRDEGFNITILPLPPVDQPEDVVTCDGYLLPALQNGEYFSAAGGKGKKILAGEVITSTRILYIYNKDSNCSNEHVFRITITPAFEDIVACGTYELPAIEVGSYYSQPLGQGIELRTGSAITSTQTVYYFAETNTATNCTDNISFRITIIPIPEVDSLDDVLLCENEVFTLPKLLKGEYFTETGRGGNQLFSGDVIKTTTTVYINNRENGCSNESSFLVEIRPFPVVENFTDIYTCTAYELPVLRHGKYFTASGGKGKQLKAGDIILTTQELFVYNSWEDLPSCNGENAFTVYVEGIDVGDFEDVLVCDSYVLPVLSEGDYFTESGGKGRLLKAGEIIAATQHLYVYSSNGTRFICTDENSFQVIVSQTPKLPAYSAVEGCGSYTLPVLSQEEYHIAYYWQTGGGSKISSSEKTISTPGNYTIYVYASAKNNSSCSSEAKFNVTVYPLLDLRIKAGTLCQNPLTGEVESKAILHSGLDPFEFEVNWFFKEKLVHTGPDYATGEPGDYRVETIKLNPGKGPLCNYKATIVSVKPSSRPVISTIVSEPFQDVAVIRVRVDQGFGEYEYRLDNGEFQQHNEFYNVESGAHKITVRGISGNCGEAYLDVVVLKYPKYFTPNNDGFNETWTIPDLNGHPEARIHVFDRYGKLLKIFSPAQSWDGYFHGRAMPSDDYWFRVTFEQDGVLREFKSHFTLMR